MSLVVFVMLIGVVFTSVGCLLIWQRRRWHPEYEPVDPDWKKDLFIMLFKNRLHQGSSTALGALCLIFGIPSLIAGLYLLFQAKY